MEFLRMEVIVLLFPLSPNSKVPPSGVSWKRTMSDKVEDHHQWRANGLNVGYPTGTPNGAVVIDFDDKVKARAFYKAYQSELRTMVETRKGVHFYYRTDGALIRNSQKKDGYDYDVRGEGGYVVYPDSVVDGWQYNFVRWHDQVETSELPLIRMDLIPPPANARSQPINDEHLRRVYRARLWIQKVPGAVSGQGGHNATYRVACHLVQRFGLSAAEAMPLFLEWNDTCKPPWRFNDLSRKLNDASQAGKTK
jgi:hypothetical protein